ncbi:hypothetical protein WAI453_008487 [Rhynchosporium graminicola]
MTRNGVTNSRTQSHAQSHHSIQVQWTASKAQIPTPRRPKYALDRGMQNSCLVLLAIKAQSFTCLLDEFS